MSYYRGNWDLTYKNHKASKIVEIFVHYLSILHFFLQVRFLVEKLSLKYFLKSRTFPENLWLIFIFYILTFFLYFSPLVTGSLRGGGGGWG